MKPEKTKPMSRKDVIAFLATFNFFCTITELHDRLFIAKTMAILGPTYAAYQYDEYDAVMGALLHFWKQS